MGIQRFTKERGSEEEYGYYTTKFTVFEPWLTTKGGERKEKSSQSATSMQPRAGRRGHGKGPLRKNGTIWIRHVDR